MEITKLYHYTSQAGLLGMMDSKSLWFTDMLYMNDSEEYHYAAAVVKEIIEKNYDKYLMSGLTNQYYLRSKHLFTFSLSAKRDTLSQWRGYCPNGGYSIRFTENDLADLISRPYLKFKKCIYNKEDIEKLVLEQIVMTTEENYYKMMETDISRESSGKARSGMPYEIAKRAYNFLPFIKHPSFEEEEEWRFVTDTTQDSEHEMMFSQQLKAREGKNSLIPYIAIPIGSQEETKKFCLDEIIVSPTPLPELSRNVCQSLFPDAKVDSSAIPYRNW